MQFPPPLTLSLIVKDTYSWYSSTIMGQIYKIAYASAVCVTESRLQTLSYTYGIRTTFSGANAETKAWRLRKAAPRSRLRDLIQ